MPPAKQPSKTNTKVVQQVAKKSIYRSKDHRVSNIKFLTGSSLFNSYANLVKTVLKHANDLEQKGNKVVQIKMDSYSSWLLTAFNKTTWFIFYEEKARSSRGSKNKLIHAKEIFHGPFTSMNTVAEKTASMLSLHPSIVSLNYDTYNGRSTVVTLFYKD